MRKTIAVLAVAATLTLAGCSTAAPPTYQPAPEVTAPAVPAPKAEPVPTHREQGLAYLRDTFPELAGVTDAQIDEYAYITCDYFDQGGTFEGSVISDMEAGLTAEQSGALTGYAVYVHCPEWAGIEETIS